MTKRAPAQPPTAPDTRTAARRALSAVAPFGEIGEAALEELIGLFVPRTLEPGELVFLEGSPGDRFFVVVAGRLRAFRHIPPAAELPVFTLGPDDFFGLLPLLDGEGYPVSVEALVRSEILVLRRADFIRFTRQHPPFCLALLAYLARRLRGSLERIGTLGRQGALARTAHALLGLAPRDTPLADGTVITLPFSQAELAGLLHVTEANLSRALKRLRAAGTLRAAGRRRFRIADVEALRRAADGA